jgi:hypothetical protein
MISLNRGASSSSGVHFAVNAITQSAVVTFNTKDFVDAERFGVKVIRSETLALLGGFK